MRLAAIKKTVRLIFRKILGRQDVRQLIVNRQYQAALNELQKKFLRFLTTPNPLHQEALCYFYLQDYDRALTLANRALVHSKDPVTTQLLIAQILSAKQDLHSALDVAMQVFNAHPTADTFAVVEEVLIQQDKEDELRQFAHDALVRVPDSGINMRGHSGYSLSQRAKDLPPILICSLPKSGSIYISSRLSAALQLPVVQLTTAGRLDGVVRSWVENFARGGVLAQEHLRPKHEDLKILKAHGIDRLVVHCRDPRSAAISMLHHMDKVHAQGGAEKYVVEKWVGAGHFQVPFAVKMENILNTVFLDYVEWIREWVALSEQNDTGINLLFTTYREMRRDAQSVFRKIIDFYNIPHSRAAFAVAAETATVHHRKGIIDEWREVLTPLQLDFSFAQMDGIAERFGWEG